MPLILTPPCARCGRLYVEGNSSLCEDCRVRKVRAIRARRSGQSGNRPGPARSRPERLPRARSRRRERVRSRARPGPSSPPEPLRCDCGALAQAVILVSVGDPASGLSEVRLPLCEDCLVEEQRTQELLAELGWGKNP